ncbi:CrcB family protein [Helcobacillus sp. ACRRO]|uniref:fluoride efflux transporter FluC n=1 Tax=Helcobacillus sp. ACRRO TaxID=2918202 RepID=UPI001EF65021|nr:CrcB family protein [Helcobacillus sp. ACRRO]MCG7427678.1 CrcB family protein [Helcobacillus sp. ACRRO]
MTEQSSRRSDLMHTAEFHAVTSADLADDRPAEAPEPGAGLTALLVGVGGALGAAMRWSLELLYPFSVTPTLAEIPVATLSANVIGCLVAGLIAGVLDARPDTPGWVRPLTVVGFCGGFTSLSTFIIGVGSIIGGHAALVALEYAFLTVGLVVLSVVFGFVVGRAGAKRRVA